jgi:hypothetical protein
MTYYGYQVIKNKKVIFVEWFYEEKDRDDVLTTLKNAFSIEDEVKRKMLLLAIFEHCSIFYNEDGITFEAITTDKDLYHCFHDISYSFYVGCEEKLMQNVARKVNSLIIEDGYYMIYCYNELENEAIKKSQNIDCWHLSDIYITYLNTEYKYNFVRTIMPNKSDTLYEKLLDCKYYIDSEKQVMLCFTRYSKAQVSLHCLHKEIVDKVIKFCKKNELYDVDEFSITADGLKLSIDSGFWTSYTDSSFSLVNEDKKQVMLSM